MDGIYEVEVNYQKLMTETRTSVPMYDEIKQTYSEEIDIIKVN